MNILAPGFLALAALAGPIILLYMLRLRRREVPISSTMLWQRLMQDREANTPWQKLRRNLLLLLQLLILLLLVLALIRPFFPVPSVAAGSVAVLIDASASMSATDVGESRFAAAQEEARTLIRDLGADEVMTVISVGPTPQVLTPPTGDKNVLREAVSRATPTESSADWGAALALAGASIAGRQDASVIIISDGGLPTDLPGIPAEVRYVSIGQEQANLAISAMATRPLGTVPQLFIAVTNYGSEDADVILSLETDGELYSAERISVPASGTTDLTITDLPETVGTIRAELTQPVEGGAPDYLPLDNVAYAVYEPPSGGDVLLVTEQNIFLQQLFTAFPTVNTFRTDPGDLPDRQFDLIVYDGDIPVELPPTNLLIINPSQSTDLFTLGATFEETRFVRQADSEILAFVEFEDIAVREATEVQAEWAETLVEAEGGPLLIAGEVDGRRVAVLTFDLRASDLPLQIAFPIMIANLLEWYAPARLYDAPDNLQPGQPITIRPRPTTTEYRVIRPDGTIRRADVNAESLTFAATNEIGVYGIELVSRNEVTASGTFAVNLFDSGESAIAPTEAITIGAAEVTGAQQGDEFGQYEFWPWLAALGLVVLVIEWWVYHRGSALPGQREEARRGAFAFLRRD